LNNEKTVIGRGKDVDIQINEPSISRHHLEIEIVGDNIIATDLNSINGSYVEGNKISKAYLLDGNSITLGSVSFNYYFKDSFES
jgi:pSer/pThr/pTyr-binding forkhead associated (FHA) protein